MHDNDSSSMLENMQTEYEAQIKALHERMAQLEEEKEKLCNEVRSCVSYQRNLSALEQKK